MKLLTCLTALMFASVLIIGSADAASFNSSRSNTSKSTDVRHDIARDLEEVANEVKQIVEEMIRLQEQSGTVNKLDYTVKIEFTLNPSRIEAK